jgi:HPt (histidine-containing phosphotransfer) domain-containing protein
MVGADNLSVLCRDLETNLRHQNYQDLESKIDKILEEYSVVKSDLEREKHKK